MSAHAPVLLYEALDSLFECEIQPPRMWLDGTFGRGGHSQSMLQRMDVSDRLLVIDRDPQACAVAQELAKADTRVAVIHDEWNVALKTLNDEDCFAGVLLDLGVSSPQLDDGLRGFSFRLDGPLDMRMNPEQGETAAQWLNSADETDISRVLWDYGEERFARRIARSIVQARPLERTDDLKQAAVRAIPAAARRKGKHDATRTFQAVRIHVNQELRGLETALPQFFERLALGARLAVITFHSLEDRLVKRFFRTLSQPPSLPRHVPLRGDAAKPRARLVGRSITPTDEETQSNPRARSARLRVLERSA